MMRRYFYPGLFSLFFFLTIRDLISRGSDAEDSPTTSGFKKKIPEMHMDRYMKDPTIHISYCYSCGYKRAFEEYSQIIKEKFPHITVIGENYSLGPLKSNLVMLVVGLKFALIGLLLLNINPYAYLGMHTPSVWQWLASHRSYGALMAFVLGNAIESQIITTGAFEISYNGILIWSKLTTGRILSPVELFQIIKSYDEMAVSHPLDNSLS